MTGLPLPTESCQSFPNLNNKNHSITSPASDNYNCIAWAFEVNDKWMWPGDLDSYWPAGVAGRDELETITQLYIDSGYEKRASGEREEGYKKVAIFVNRDGPTHAALQLDSGHWTSKLGREEDIQHGTLQALEGGPYGQAVIFLRKPRA
ncbi:MAG: hypothetical protein HY528_02260 [Chloroflexi bacterium]|nr:hypothetical protein [Chloroflexota bacterium]